MLTNLLLRSAVFAFALLAYSASNSRAGKISGIPASDQAILAISESTWTPSAPQAKACLGIIQAYLDKTTSERNVTAIYGGEHKLRRLVIASDVKQILATKDGYRVQFWGIDYKGRKAVYCNFFPAAGGSTFGPWKKEKVQFFDGGTSFFQATCDLASKSVVFFDCNGLALNSEPSPGKDAFASFPLASSHR